MDQKRDRMPAKVSQRAALRHTYRQEDNLPTVQAQDVKDAIGTANTATLVQYLELSIMAPGGHT